MLDENEPIDQTDESLERQVPDSPLTLADVKDRIESLSRTYGSCTPVKLTYCQEITRIGYSLCHQGIVIADVKDLNRLPQRRQ
jgi:hypothetical protein